MINLENDKVGLREPRMSDLDRLFRWEGDSAGMAVPGRSRFELWQYLSTVAEHEDAGFVRAIIVAGHCAEAIGYVDMDLEVEGSAKVGIYVDAAFRGKGYGRAALAAMMEWTVSERGVGEFMAEIEAANSASQRLFGGAGFELAGERGGVQTWVGQLRK